MTTELELRERAAQLLGEHSDDKGLIWTRAAAAVADEAERIVEGIALPWGEIANLGYFTESIERGAVQDSDDAQTWYRHREPIGKLLDHEDQDSGWFVRNKISKTTLGNDAFTLAQDGVLPGFSIGFEPDEYTVREENGVTHITHTKIRVREISLVPLGAYPGAQITNVRAAHTTPKGQTMPEENDKAPASLPSGEPTGDTLLLREQVGNLERRIETLQIVDRPAEIDQRSAGAIAKALVQGDQATVDAYEQLMQRAYTGATSAESYAAPKWVGDLTRIVDEAAPLRDIFSTGVLPEEGNTLEFAKLKSITGAADTQENEGDDLDYIEVAVEIDNTPVITGGGWSEISKQSIQRSSVNILDHTFRAQAISLGKWLNARTRAKYNEVRAAQVVAANTVTLGSPLATSDYQDWLDLLVDAAIKYERLGLPISGLVANPLLFKALGHVTAEDGRPLLLVDGSGNNNIGTFNPVGLSASLAGCTIRLDAGLANGAPLGSFVNKQAIRVYDDGLKRLQDENIVNLTEQFSVYTYAAFADEIPEAIVPIVIPAP